MEQSLLSLQQQQQQHQLANNQGLPIFEYKNGTYQGEYFKNLRQGKGVYYWHDGQIYIGMWNNDFIQGQGTIYFAYGGNFVGFFKANKAHGAGILTLPDSTIYCGQWEHGRLKGQSAKFDPEENQWTLVEYVSSFLIKIKKKDSSNIAVEINKRMQQEINTPFYQQQIQQTPQTCLQEIDRFRLKILQLDQNIFYHGIARGQRPDGLGILFHQKINFSLRGKFANAKLSGIGKVELDNGEIYDGVFRNGIFCQGVFYNTKENQYIYGSFKSPEPQLFEKGNDYPYKLFWENKNKIYTTNMIYKSTTYQLFYIPSQDQQQIQSFNPEKYLNGNEEEQSQDYSNQNQISFNQYINLPLERHIDELKMTNNEGESVNKQKQQQYENYIDSQRQKQQIIKSVNNSKQQQQLGNQSFNKTQKQNQQWDRQDNQKTTNKYQKLNKSNFVVDNNNNISQDSFSFSNENLQQELKGIKSEKKIFSLKEGNNSTIIDLLNTNTENINNTQKELFNNHKIIFDTSCRFEENSELIFKQYNSSQFGSQLVLGQDQQLQDDQQQSNYNELNDQAFIISKHSSMENDDFNNNNKNNHSQQIFKH